MSLRFLGELVDLDVEQSLLRQHAAQKYTGPALLSSGNTELFSADVLGLDSHI